MWVIPVLLGLTAVGVLFYGTGGTTSKIHKDDDPFAAGVTYGGGGEIQTTTTSDGRVIATKGGNSLVNNDYVAYNQEVEKKLDAFGYTEGALQWIEESHKALENSVSTIKELQEDKNEAVKAIKDLTDESQRFLDAYAEGGASYKKIWTDGYKKAYDQAIEDSKHPAPYSVWDKTVHVTHQRNQAPDLSNPEVIERFKRMHADMNATCYDGHLSDGVCVANDSAHVQSNEPQHTIAGEA